MEGSSTIEYSIDDPLLAKLSIVNLKQRFCSWFDEKSTLDLFIEKHPRTMPSIYSKDSHFMIYL